MIVQIYAFINPDTAAQAAQLGVNQNGFAVGERREEKDQNGVAACAQTVHDWEGSIQISEDAPAVTVYGAGFSLNDREGVARFLASTQVDTFAGAFHPFNQEVLGVPPEGARP